MSLPDTANDEIRQQAKLRAKHKQAEQRRLDAVKALKAHDLSRNAEQAKTMRLRQLRLTKEAEEAVARKERETAKGAKPRRVKKAAVGKG